ncbi:LysR family transcriptional regulator [Propionivibrio sp.]|uniref:LysR family transcriptional regulator n=1 Tax=Propionivibrio sp. TaxID=2212460 RepID=UPI0039E31B30
MPKFDWNDLQAFLALARAERITVAAQQMGIDHSTLSRRIASLESAMGVPLFDRRKEGCFLTPEGKHLVEDAEAVEALTLRMRSRFEDESAGLTGKVRIGTPEGFGTYFLAPRIAKVSDLYPGLEIELVANPRHFCLSKREADLAVSMGPPEDGRVYARKLVDYSLGLYASRTYCDSRPPIRSREDLEHHRWIGYVEDLMWTQELNYLPQVSKNIAPPLHISNVISQMTAMLGSAGIGVLPVLHGPQRILTRPHLAGNRPVAAFVLVDHPRRHAQLRARQIDVRLPRSAVERRRQGILAGLTIKPARKNELD